MVCTIRPLKIKFMENNRSKALYAKKENEKFMEEMTKRSMKS